MRMWGWSLVQLNCHPSVGWNVARGVDWRMNFAQQRAAHSELLIRSQNKSYNITSQGGTAASAALRQLTSEVGPVCPASGGFHGLKDVLFPMFLGCLHALGVFTTVQENWEWASQAWKDLDEFMWLKDAHFPCTYCFSRLWLNVCQLEEGETLEPMQVKSERQWCHVRINCLAGLFLGSQRLW